MSKKRARKVRAKQPAKKPKKSPSCIKMKRKRPKTKQIVLPPLPGTKAFVALQAEWYEKLEQSGFNDLELANYNTGEALPLLRRQSLHSIAKTYDPEKLRYYQRWSCFLVHNPRFSASYLLIAAAKLYAEGKTYRQMRDILRPKYGKGTSIERLHAMIHELEPRVLQWNARDHRGLDYYPDIEP